MVWLTDSCGASAVADPVGEVVIGERRPWPDRKFQLLLDDLIGIDGDGVAGTSLGVECRD